MHKQNIRQCKVISPISIADAAKIKICCKTATTSIAPKPYKRYTQGEIQLRSLFICNK